MIFKGGGEKDLIDRNRKVNRKTHFGGKAKFHVVRCLKTNA